MSEGKNRLEPRHDESKEKFFERISEELRNASAGNKREAKNPYLDQDYIDFSNNHCILKPDTLHKKITL